MLSSCGSVRGLQGGGIGHADFDMFDELDQERHLANA